jgi:hypothetical protein
MYTWDQRLKPQAAVELCGFSTEAGQTAQAILEMAPQKILIPAMFWL